MREYDDLKLFEFPIKNRIENMPIGALYMLRIADGLYNIYLKINDEYSYSLKSNRRVFGKYEEMTPTWFRNAWEQPYNALNVIYNEFVPYYQMSHRTNTYELGYMKKNTIELWLLKARLVKQTSDKIDSMVELDAIRD